jgi:hypothetical protein
MQIALHRRASRHKIMHSRARLRKLVLHSPVHHPWSLSHRQGHHHMPWLDTQFNIRKLLQVHHHTSPHRAPSPRPIRIIMQTRALASTALATGSSTGYVSLADTTTRILDVVCFFTCAWVVSGLKIADRSCERMTVPS